MRQKDTKQVKKGRARNVKRRERRKNEGEKLRGISIDPQHRNVSQSNRAKSKVLASCLTIRSHHLSLDLSCCGSVCIFACESIFPQGNISGWSTKVWDIMQELDEYLVCVYMQIWLYEPCKPMLVVLQICSVYPQIQKSFIVFYLENRWESFFKVGLIKPQRIIMFYSNFTRCIIYLGVEVVASHFHPSLWSKEWLGAVTVYPGQGPLLLYMI